jgi:hypothetical protein
MAKEAGEAVKNEAEAMVDEAKDKAVDAAKEEADKAVDEAVGKMKKAGNSG